MLLLLDVLSSDMCIFFLGPWAKDDDGAYFKAALLSGPLGIGKL